MPRDSGVAVVLTLYHGEISTCSQKVRLALAEKRLDYERISIDVPAGEHLTDWYLALNPNGVVPTLVHDGRAVVDSSVICEYLDEVFPEPALSPPDPGGRAEMRAWMRHFEEVPTAAIRIPSFNRVLIKHFQALSDDARRARLGKMPLRKHFYEDMGRSGFSERDYTRSLDRLETSLTRVESALADGRDYLLGTRFSIADIVFVPTAVRMIDIGLGPLVDKRPFVSAWLSRVEARPSFADAYRHGSRLS